MLATGIEAPRRGWRFGSMPMVLRLLAVVVALIQYRWCWKG